MDVSLFLSFVVVFFTIAFVNAILVHVCQTITRFRKIKQDTANQSIVIKTCCDIILHRLFYGYAKFDNSDIITIMLDTLPIILMTSPINCLIINDAHKEFMRDIAKSLAESYFHQYVKILRSMVIQSIHGYRTTRSKRSPLNSYDLFILIPENGLIFDKIEDIDKDNITFKGNSLPAYRQSSGNGDEKPIHFSIYTIKDRAFSDDESPAIYIQYASCLKVLQDLKITFNYTSEDIAYMVNIFFSALTDHIKNLSYNLSESKIHIILFSGKKEDFINTIIQYSLYPRYIDVW